MKNISTMKRMFIAGVILVAFGGLIFLIQKSGREEDDSSSVGSVAPALGEGQSVTQLSPGEKRYAHSLIGFSFTYPETLSISSFGSMHEEGGETVLLQGDGGAKGLQILITSFDEDISLAEERIHRDIPDLAMSDVSTRTLGTGDRTAQAVIFTSENSFMGKSKEAWFVREKRLYQISAPESAQEVFVKALDSWEF
jgi:hypothetical protein